MPAHTRMHTTRTQRHHEQAAASDTLGHRHIDARPQYSNSDDCGVVSAVKQTTEPHDQWCAAGSGEYSVASNEHTNN